MSRLAALRDAAPNHAFTVYWKWWAVLAFSSFIVPELWALFTNWQNTLSANVWRMEDFLPGQPVWRWTAVHFLFIGMLLVLFMWLIGHFGWGIWR
ncbi:MAG TPA: hypothetical protein VFW64_12315 [Pseudonocardiaceae bacterium]|nr:hypothetical protein [Pseudonocardiaceae bacterium]